MNKPTAKNIDRLLEYLPIFQRPRYKFFTEKKGDYSCILSKEAEAFYKDLYEQNMIVDHTHPITRGREFLKL